MSTRGRGNRPSFPFRRDLDRDETRWRELQVRAIARDGDGGRTRGKLVLPSPMLGEDPCRYYPWRARGRPDRPPSSRWHDRGDPWIAASSLTYELAQ